MLDQAAGLIERHGWHVIAEVGVGVVLLVFGILYFAQLIRGRAQAVTCPSCGRLSSRAHVECPRCGARLAASDRVLERPET